MSDDPYDPIRGLLFALLVVGALLTAFFLVSLI